MTPIVHTDLEVLDGSALKAICASPGPFVTVYLPARQAGASDLPVAPRLRRIARSAAAELVQRHYAEPLERILDPLEELASDAAMSAGSPNTVILCSPGGLGRFRIPAPVGERLIVSTHPYITPLLRHLAVEFYFLSVNPKQVRLGCCGGGEYEEIRLPDSIPSSLMEAGGFDQPDHTLEGRSAAGGSQRVRFGTSQDREKYARYLHDYLRLLDRELAGILGGAPLVLVGVAEDLAAYQRAAKYQRILEARHTSAAHMPLSEIGRLAREAVREARVCEAEALAREIREAKQRNHVVRGLREILEAAHEGRIHKLILAEGAESEGLPGPLYAIEETKLEGKQDLLNAAAVETIRGGGDVLTLNASRMGDLAPAVAVLRYSPR
jgi:hypothetical protein